MNADELALLYSALSVKEMERPIRTLDTNLINNGARRLSICLVEKILTTRQVNRSAFIDVITSVWPISEGMMIGEVRDIDLEATREGNGHYIWVRVAFAANEPFMRCLRVDLLGTGKVTTMLLRYERLLDFCFKCSRLGHSMRECIEVRDVKEVTSEANVRLNIWLRAVSPSKRFPGRNKGFDQGSWGR
ncbi:hypothetical protein EZV62_027471 [Acer yangbiense]|uniref:CCHC-type domain-containing protein n=1 Tax=Acer yangbiense TaxID=1000413 RepID=A0A5C7GUP8_9ROSI|nr:hypothetical protein EZV62_027471 [Acer yangbiense]